MLASLSLIFTANNPRQPQVNTRNRSPVPHDQGEAAVGHHLHQENWDVDLYSMFHVENRSCLTRGGFAAHTSAD